VSAVTTDNTSHPPSTSKNVTSITHINDTVCFFVVTDNKWMIDLGCTDHITYDINDYSEYQTLPTPRKVLFADKTTSVSYIGTGTVTGTTRVNGREQKIVLHDVLHSPEIDKKGFSMTFSASRAIIRKDDTIRAEGHIQGQHYWITIQANTPSIHAVQTNVPIETLHAWLGHLSWSALQRLLNSTDHAHRRILSTCKGCLLGKSKRRTFKLSTHRHTHPVELIHMDLAGPMKTRSIQSNMYHFILVDDYTRYKWVMFLPSKSDAFKAFKKFHVLVSTYYKGTLRAARSDQGGEFLSKDFTGYMEEHGILHQLTVPHTPQQNGVAERANRTMAEAARAMMQGAGMSQGFWECAVATAVHIRNRAPSRVTGYVSPHERLFNY
jgi:transposase InsO family protein